MNRSYLLISPGRNEAEYMRQTLDSVVAQSIRPAMWVIVDDGSTDDTPAILAEYAARARLDPGRDPAAIAGVAPSDPGVIEAFYAGYDTIDPRTTSTSASSTST